MTLYEQIHHEQQVARAALDRIYQQRDYAVRRVDVTPRVTRAFGQCAVRVQRPKPAIAPDAVQHAVEAVRQSNGRGS